MSTRITAMSKFFEAWMTRGCEDRVMSLNMCVFERVVLTCEVLKGLRSLSKYGTPSILRKDLDCRRRSEISFDSRLPSPLKYFSKRERLLVFVMELVVTMIPLSDSLIQSILIWDLYDFRRPLICPMWVLAASRILFLSGASCYDLPWTGLLTSGDSGCH